MPEPKTDTTVAGTMFTVAQCLEKAVELERRADGNVPPDVRDDYRDMAREWRRLACRALVQEARISAFRTPEA